MNDASSIMHEVHILLRKGKRSNTGFSLTASKLEVDANFFRIKDVLDELTESIDTTRDLNKWDAVLAELRATLFKRRCTIESNIKKCSQLERSDDASTDELRRDRQDLRNIEEDLK